MANSVSFDFTGKTALVTGGARGIGRGISEALIEAGAKTFALGRTQKHLDDLVAKCPSIHPVCVDLTNWEETRKAVEEIGPVDLLVNNAGVAILNRFLELSEESIDRILDVNLKAAINVSQVVARGMIERKCPGSIVNMSSLGSLRAAVQVGLYTISKSALDGLTRSMALELGPHQIRVNSVNPTIVWTDMAKQIFPEQADASALTARTPLGRLAVLSEVVEPVMYLLSDSSSMINGAFLSIDGGFTVW